MSTVKRVCCRSLLAVGFLTTSVLWAGEIDLKLTTTDGSSQVSVVNGSAADVANIDSSGNLTFTSTLKPNGQSGTAGEVLQSNGSAAAPTWVAPTPLPMTLLNSTNTWTAQQIYTNPIIVSSNITVTNGGVLSGNGSGLTNLPPAALTSGVYGTITGVGAQSQALNMNTNPINNVSGPTADSDAATKAYVDTATGTASMALLSATNTWTASQTYSNPITVSSNITVTNGGILSGNGSGLTNLTPAALTSDVYGAITGLGTQSQALNMNSNPINNVSGPTADSDAATKAYVDAATGTVSTTLLSTTNTWTAQQTYATQITVSTSMLLTGSFLANGSAGTAGQILQSLGNGSAPAWISSTTLLGGTPVLNQGALSLAVSAKSVSYGMTAADFGILGNAGGGVITITLPSAANAGKMVFIVKTEASANNVVIAAAGGDTIEGSASVNLSSRYQKNLLIADGGATWYVMSQ